MDEHTNTFLREFGARQGVDTAQFSSRLYQAASLERYATRQHVPHEAIPEHELRRLTEAFRRTYAARFSGYLLWPVKRVISNLNKRVSPGPFLEGTLVKGLRRPLRRIRDLKRIGLFDVLEELATDDLAEEEPEPTWAGTFTKKYKDSQDKMLANPQKARTVVYQALHQRVSDGVLFLGPDKASKACWPDSFTMSGTPFITQALEAKLQFRGPKRVKFSFDQTAMDSRLTEMNAKAHAYLLAPGYENVSPEDVPRLEKVIETKLKRMGAGFN